MHTSYFTMEGNLYHGIVFLICIDLPSMHTIWHTCTGITQALGDTQYILWLTSPHMHPNYARQEKKWPFRIFFYFYLLHVKNWKTVFFKHFFLWCEPERIFYFWSFFLGRGQNDPCQSSSTKQYTECGLKDQVSTHMYTINLRHYWQRLKKIIRPFEVVIIQTIIRKAFRKMTHKECNTNSTHIFPSPNPNSKVE